MKTIQHAGKILYAIVFLLIVPLVQWWWALSLENTVRFPPVASRNIGAVAGVAGILVMAWGMFSLKKFGKGLPMNAYPPHFYVKQGPYRFLRHPIYWGYGFLMVGVFIFTGSASGLWIVTPISILAMIALVMGYEAIDLKKRFKDTDQSVLLDIPSATEGVPVLAQRLATLFWIIMLLLCANYIVWFLTHNTTPFWNDSLTLPFFNELNSVQFFTIAYILVVPLIIKSNSILHWWTISVIAGIILSTYIALLWPEVGAQYFYISTDIIKNKELTAILGAPVFLCGLSAIAYVKQFKKGVLFILPLAIIISLAQLANTRSILLNLTVSVFILFVTANYKTIWMLIRNTAEKIANSWKEWEWGPVRIINHGIYVGVGSFGGILFCGLLVGKAYAWAILLFAFVVIVFAALWAQIIEGSEKLKRPFGYYGALVGILFAGTLLWIMGYNEWVLIGIISVVMPWVQAAGRLRCLVNGCCHGKPTDNSILGIRFYHYRSRVCNISGLKGKYLHPTQVYSILWLFFTGFLLLALWLHSFSYSFIFGMYLILTSTGRFVEEAYRGEVQTPVWSGLRLYQWAAIASVLAGIIFTTIDIPVVTLQPAYGWEIWLVALVGGFFTFFAMGVDFPRSNARFSRLV
ncbi:prolipoprotein diacylglyceryl transferase family protein [Panacibacter ginsenosidivorans]|nr:prolipoprotein diacylglyceryl transferase family protein [Panacibacter ginsenosidivorans]